MGDRKAQLSICACLSRGKARLLGASLVPGWHFDKHLWSFLAKAVATGGACQIRSTRAVVVVLPLQVMAEVMRMIFISVACSTQGVLSREMCQLGKNQKNMCRGCHLLPPRYRSWQCGPVNGFVPNVSYGKVCKEKSI